MAGDKQEQTAQSEQIEASARLLEIRARTRRRFAYAGVSLALYFLFVLNWTTAGSFLSLGIGDSPITGGLLMFILLVLIFLGMEVAFLRGSGIGFKADQQRRDPDGDD